MLPTAARRLRAASALALVALVAAGTAEGGAAAAPDVTAVQRSAAPRVVVAITIDGLRSNAIGELGSDRAPALYRMIRQGASTLNARTAVEQTGTMPNHSGVLTGRRVLGARGHRVTFNDDSATTDIHTVAGRYIPSMFDVVHDRGGLVKFFSGKDKFAFFDRSWDERRGARDVVGVDDGRDKIDTYVYDENTTALVDRVVRSLRRDPATLTFLHIRLPDSAGHEFGWFSDRYRSAVEESSAQVGRILRTVARSESLRSRAAVVLTADHGGEGRAHRDASQAVTYTVPFLVWGSGVAAGTDLYDLNPARVDPGTAQPAYSSGAPPVRNLDLASLVTTYLGMGPVPGGVAPGTDPLAAWTE